MGNHYGSKNIIITHEYEFTSDILWVSISLGGQMLLDILKQCVIN